VDALKHVRRIHKRSQNELAGTYLHAQALEEWNAYQNDNRAKQKLKHAKGNGKEPEANAPSNSPLTVQELVHSGVASADAPPVAQENFGTVRAVEVGAQVSEDVGGIVALHQGPFQWQKMRCFLKCTMDGSCIIPLQYGGVADPSGVPGNY